MNNLRSIILEAFEKATNEKKEIYLKKGNTFTGIYFRTILEYIQKSNKNFSFFEKGLSGKLKDTEDRREIKKELYILISENLISVLHIGGGLMFMHKEEYGKLMKEKKM